MKDFLKVMPIMVSMSYLAINVMIDYDQFLFIVIKPWPGTGKARSFILLVLYRSALKAQ